MGEKSLNSYGEIISTQRQNLSKNIDWWPLYLFHFTDVHNAVSIIEKEYILGRKEVTDKNLMKSDNASSRVIEVTNDEVARYARLYMRPKTPTQYHNEGYKPPHIREKNLNACCPVPIFFLLDAEKTLSMDGVRFVEKGLAGNSYDNALLQKGPEDFSKLNFQKIFHDGPFPSGSDITQYRHTEVILKDGLPISEVLKGIACRSIAEKQTLLYLLRKTSIERFTKYKDIIMYKPDTDLFYNNGVYVKDFKYENKMFVIYLNTNSYRYNSSSANGEDIDFQINIDWLGSNMEFLSRSTGNSKLDYANIHNLFYKPKRIKNSLYALVEIRFDDVLMYQNVINLDEYEIV